LEGDSEVLIGGTQKEFVCPRCQLLEAQTARLLPEGIRLLSQALIAT
jgi:hypothetical protein